MTSSSPLMSLLGLWFMFQIASSVISSLAAIYLLFCLGKSAAAMDRLASAVELLVERQTAPGILPQGLPPSGVSQWGTPSPVASPAPAPIPGIIPVVSLAPVAAPVPESSATPPPETPTTPPSNVPYIPRREVMP